ncbi:hypothetical protein QTP81_13585 [Alteromonas sp. ASW11-36]|uniref:SPOR domain-containing protein n=1 Tax=Alteromonas arenosi TaxID=3055817 RepID=A0ABT7SZM2_9ALTE|nr:hypothetical protein [Alteromonas sp. ASW11-36]MDM7861627.1 hypothetical protein [Alteromonas sp. ASW11-36]
MNAVQSELHHRLNQMVNYSSQLIFVSSDGIGQQQRTLESFLADQDELTEVAFIAARPSLPITQYRRQICQQLLGQVAGSFVRPLNELLESLNHHDGPVLIGITQAQLLPNAFLQELWQLVLQSRFAANKQHLNIVLFGETQWAEQAQKWLPAKNTATPLLLSSETVLAPRSELDALIAQKRRAFHQRLAKRTATPENDIESVPLLRKPWFILCLIACFFACFSALLAWQYPQQMAKLLGIEEAPLAPVSEIVEVQSATPERRIDSVDETPVTEQTSVTEQLLVQTWENDSSESPQASQALEQTLNESEPVAELLIASEAETVVIVEPTVTANDTSMQALVVPPLSETEAETAITQQLQQFQVPENNAFVIQLVGVSSYDLAVRFARDNNLMDSVWVYETQLGEQPWFVIVYANYYTTLDIARDAIAELPNYNQLSAPFVKSINQIARELQR